MSVAQIQGLLIIHSIIKMNSEWMKEMYANSYLINNTHYIININ